MAEYHPLSGVAYEIHQELEFPDTPTTGSVFYWLETNAGKLNNKISTFYSFVSGDYSPQLGHDERDILKALYFTQYYANEGRKALSNLSSNNVLTLKDDQSSVSFVNNKDVAKVWIEQGRFYNKEAQDLSNLYKHNRSGPRDPSQSWTGHWE